MSTEKFQPVDWATFPDDKAPCPRHPEEGPVGQVFGRFAAKYFAPGAATDARGTVAVSFPMCHRCAEGGSIRGIPVGAEALPGSEFVATARIGMP